MLHRPHIHTMLSVVFTLATSALVAGASPAAIATISAHHQQQNRARSRLLHAKHQYTLLMLLLLLMLQDKYKLRNWNSGLDIQLTAARHCSGFRSNTSYALF